MPRPASSRSCVIASSAFTHNLPAIAVTSLTMVLALVLPLATLAARQSDTPTTPQQTETPPTQSSAQPWDAGTQYPDKELTSNLTITNDCKKTHSFSITVEAPFLSLKGVTHVMVPGKKSVNLPAVFDTRGMAPGDYTGLVTVLCLDCEEVPPCVQNRKDIAPHVTIIAPPGPTPIGGTTPTSGGTTPTTPENPPVPVTNDCQESANDCSKLIPQILAAIEALKAARAEYSAAAEAYDFWDYWADEDCADADAWHSYILGARMLEQLAGSGGPTSEELAEARAAEEDCEESEARFDQEDSALIQAGRAILSAQSALDDLLEEYRQCIREYLKKCPFKPNIGVDYHWRGSDLGWTPPPPPTTPPGPPPQGPPPHRPLARPPEAPKTTEQPPCPTSDDCEKLRLIWEQKQAEAKALQANADRAKAYADQKQAEADAAAKTAADAQAAVPKVNKGTGWMESGGITLTSHDLQLANAASQQAYADYKAGRISLEQLQDIWAKSGDPAEIIKLRDAENAAIAEAQKKADDAANTAAAAKAIAESAAANARTAQAAEDQATADAEAAHQAYLYCLKQIEECQRGETTGGGSTGGGTTGGGTTGGGTTGGGTTGVGPGGEGNPPPHTQENPCPPFPENCDELKAKWEQLKHDADVAQAQADYAKQQQDANNQAAAGYEEQADKAQKQADYVTNQANEWRQLAGNMAALEQSAIQHRNAFPPGSADYNSWDQLAQGNAEQAKYENEQADRLEAEERQNDALAAKLKTQATQLRGLASDAQAKADQAKAAADAASQAWQDCLARKKAYDEDCKKKAAEIPKTVSRPTPTPPPPKPTNPNPPPTKPPDATGQVGTSTIFVLSQHGMPDAIVVGEPRVDHPGLSFGPHYNFAGKGSFTFICNKPGTYKVIFDTDDGRRHVVTIVCPEPQ